MLDIKQLTDNLNNILLDTPIAKSSAKSDYCPNGLQIEGKSEIKNIVTGVSASLELINEAINLNADAIIVHHGFFWKSESLCITNIKKTRIKALLDNNISLYAYHLPLDINPEIGNNRMLGEHLEIFNNIRELNNINNSNILDGLIYQGEIKNQSGMLFDDFADHLFKSLDHKPLAIKANNNPIKKVAWCTGAGQNFITEAYGAGITTFLSGEISEQTVHQAKEMGVNYFACGHHATERYGIKALSDKLNGDNLNINVKFIDLYIPV
jgi:dinuclear metal center YbgI/SA1388 family protein